jgi:hypothetical protein
MGFIFLFCLPLIMDMCANNLKRKTTEEIGNKYVWIIAPPTMKKREVTTSKKTLEEEHEWRGRRWEIWLKELEGLDVKMMFHYAVRWN